MSTIYTWCLLLMQCTCVCLYGVADTPKQANLILGGDCGGVEFVSRAEWKARHPVDVVHIPTPVKMVFIHHTDTEGCTTETDCIKLVEIIQNFHMDSRGWWDIAYSFLVGEDGRVYVGRGWDVEGAHTRGYNNVSLGFSMIGNFMKRLPNDKAQMAIKNILQCGMNLGYITPGYELFGHRDGGCTDCPGDALYAEIQTWKHYSHRKIKKHCKPEF